MIYKYFSILYIENVFVPVYVRKHGSVIRPYVWRVVGWIFMCTVHRGVKGYQLGSLTRIRTCLCVGMCVCVCVCVVGSYASLLHTKGVSLEISLLMLSSLTFAGMNNGHAHTDKCHFSPIAAKRSQSWVITISTAPPPPPHPHTNHHPSPPTPCTPQSSPPCPPTPYMTKLSIIHLREYTRAPQDCS